MNIEWKSLADREKEAMTRYAEQLVDDWDASNKAKQDCKHVWFEVIKSRNEVWKICNRCTKRKEFHWTNEQLREAARHAEDFAQPGTKLWYKLYGDRTPEQVREMNLAPA